MQVDDAGHYEFARQIDGIGPGRRLQLCRGPHPCDAAIIDDHGGGRHRWSSGPIKQREALENSDFAVGGCREQQSECGGNCIPPVSSHIHISLRRVHCKISLAALTRKPRASQLEPTCGYLRRAAERNVSIPRGAGNKNRSLTWPAISITM